MADIFDVAKYILEKQGDVTAMKLQKLCYYSQAWSLAWDEVPIFDEDFEAWANGPVSPSLFNAHRGLFLVTQQCLPNSASVNHLTQRETDTINRVLSFYADKSPHWLSELTHHERPWKETRLKANAQAGESCSEIIPKELMQDYYAGL
ncbi:MAG: DUF4065 domain-containing protein [Roseburia sp.]|nr:DUF4065 domain-containing protein [Roseburia sp.]